MSVQKLVMRCVFDGNGNSFWLVKKNGKCYRLKELAQVEIARHKYPVTKVLTEERESAHNDTWTSYHTDFKIKLKSQGITADVSLADLYRRNYVIRATMYILGEEYQEKVRSL